MSHRTVPFLILLLTIGFAACLMPAQTDTWWQLRTGEEMCRSGRIMLHDEYTHTIPGRHWPNHEWLSQLLFYGAYSLGGMPLLTALCAASVMLAWAVIGSLTAAPPLARIALVGGCAMLSNAAWSLRPQTLTLAMFAVTLWILVRQRFLFALPLVILAWANLHGAVALGGVLVAAALAATAILQRDALPRLIAVSAACLAATAATPLGASLWTEVPYSFARLQAYGVLEWRAPQLTNPADLPFWAIGFAVVVLAVVKRERLQSREHLTLVIASVLMMMVAMRSRRNIPPFLLCAAPTLAALLDLREPAREGGALGRPAANAAILSVAAAVGLLFVGYAWSKPLPRLRWQPVSEQMAAAVRGCPGPLYNRYDEGGYLIWFVRDRKVFIDSRQDPFPQDLVLDHIRMERTGDYEALFAKHGIECALTPPASPLARSLTRDGWQATPAGSTWQVFRKPSPIPAR